MFRRNKQPQFSGLKSKPSKIQKNSRRQAQILLGLFFDPEDGGDSSVRTTWPCCRESLRSNMLHTMLHSLLFICVLVSPFTAVRFHLARVSKSYTEEHVIETDMSTESHDTDRRNLRALLPHSVGLEFGSGKSRTHLPLSEKERKELHGIACLGTPVSLRQQPDSLQAVN
jgi:hypothetical protein